MAFSFTHTSRGACALLGVVLLATPVARSADSPPSLEGVARTFVGESEQHDPLFADSIGVHAYDARLDDYSAAGHARRIAWLRRWRERIARVRDAGLSAGDGADARALLDTIDLELFEDRTIAPVKTDPTLYTNVLGQAMYALIGRHYAPPETRLGHVASRLAEVPGIVRAAEAQLTRPTRVATLQAIDDNAGNLELYASLPAAATHVSPAIREAIAARLPAALASLRNFSRFLRVTLLPRSNGNPRVGAAVFDRELGLANGTDESRATLVADALADFKSTRATMLALALPFDRRFFPTRTADETKANAQDVVIHRVLDRLANAHPTRDGVFPAAKADVARVEVFLRAHPVVVLPQPSTLYVVPTPDFMAGFSGASLDPPGPFTPRAESYFYIDKIPAAWSVARVASYLRDFNDYELQMLSIHEAVPGHYVQFRDDAAVPSIVRRVFANGSYVEGWAVYGEGMILDAGYRSDDPALRLFQLKWRLREEANTIIDAAFHTGDLSEARCADFLERGAFQERSQAQTKWHRLNLSHDQLTTYFVGLDAIRKAQAAERERLGNAFDLADFNRRLLALGSVEPRFIATLLAPPHAATQQPAPSPVPTATELPTR